jgi:hypothetical protein
MKHWLGKVAIFSSIVVGSSALCQQTAQIDANNLDEAAGEVYTQSRLLSQGMQTCQTAAPDKAFQFQLADYIWHGRNYKVTLAAEKALGEQGRQRLAAPIHGLANTASAALASAPQTCHALAANILNGGLDVITSLPKAYGFLMQVYGETPALAALARPREFQDGCVIQYSRKGGNDFSVGVAHCGCLGESFAELSQQEQDDFIAHAKDTAYVSTAPWMPKFRNNAKACLAAKHIP